MSGRNKYQRNKLIRLFIEYGFHFWLLIFLSNVIVFYTFKFFIMASDDQPVPIPTSAETTASVSVSPEIPTPTPTDSYPTNTPFPSPTPTPIGPVLSMSFSLPGISSIGGNINPLHKKRDVYLYLYNSDVNTADLNVKPLITVKTVAYYDDNPNSTTYTSFVNKYIDMGRDVLDNYHYQIGIKTQQTLMQLVKDPDSTSLGGKIFRLARNNPSEIEHQDMITGDIYPIPTADNIMDINDYNMYVNCYGKKASTQECLNGTLADLDDNGVVDGIDYNYMLLSFETLQKKGYPIPQLQPPSKIIINTFPTNPFAKITLPISIEKKSSPSPTLVVASKSSSGGGGGGILGIIFFLILIIAGAFAAFKFHLLDNILKKGNANNQQIQQEAQPQAETQQPVTNETAVYEQTTQPAAAPPQPNNTPPPVQQSSGAPAISTVQNISPTPSDSSGLIEKSGFLKKVTVDNEKNGTWVTIADDNGITRGFYKSTSVTDGFSKVKGTMKTDADGKQYIEITELTPEG